MFGFANNLIIKHQHGMTVENIVRKWKSNLLLIYSFYYLRLRVAKLRILLILKIMFKSI